MYFSSRTDAGERLAASLQHYKGAHAVVYAVPRGGVPVGLAIARSLEVPFDIIPAGRIAHPHARHHAVGAVAATGEIVYNEKETKNLDTVWLRWAVLFAERDVLRKSRLLDGIHRHTSPAGKIAIVVSDGAATGLVMSAALRALRKAGPAKIIVAVPNASHDAMRILSARADMVVTLDDTGSSYVPTISYYADTRRLSDRDVVHMVKKHDRAFYT